MRHPPGGPIVEIAGRQETRSGCSSLVVADASQLGTAPGARSVSESSDRSIVEHD